MLYGLGGHLGPLGLLGWWILINMVGSRARWTLFFSAPFAGLFMWVVWMGVQGWPGTFDQQLALLGEFMLALLPGTLLVPLFKTGNSGTAPRLVRR